MGTVSDMIQSLEGLNIKTESKKAILLNKKEMIMLNQAQLFSGKDTKGDGFKPYAWDWYAQEKHQANPLPGKYRPDLYLTGRFYRGFFMVIMGDEIWMDSMDPKSQMLQGKYGGDDGNLVFGLSDENHELFTDDLFWNDFKTAIEAKTGLKFNS